MGQTTENSSGLSSRSEGAWKEVADLLGAVLYRHVKYDGPLEDMSVFSINKFGDQKLPAALELQRAQFDSREEVVAAWQKLTALYRSNS